MTSTTAPETPPVTEPPAAPTLRRQVIRGSLQTVAGYGVVQALRLGSNLALTRLLFPEHFGTMGLCWVALEGIELFSDVGIRPAIVHSKLGDQQSFLDTAWTIQVVRGFLVWLVACLMGPVLAWFYPEHPELLYLLPVVGFAAVLSGFYSTKVITAMKAMRPLQALGVQIFGQLCMVAVMVTLAAIYHSIWALAIGSLVNPFVQMVVSHVVLPGTRNRLHWNRDHAKALFRYGTWVFVSTMFTFLARQTDRLMLAKFIEAAIFGVYNTALVGLSMCVEVVSHVVEWVAFPAYARKINAGEPIGSAFRRITTVIQLGAGAIVSSLIVAAPALIDTLYDHRYENAGWMLRILGFSAWFTVLEGCCSSLHKALGTNKWMASGHAAKFFTLLWSIPVGFSLGGGEANLHRAIEFALVGVAIGDVARYAVSAYGIARQGYLVFGRDLATSALLLTAVGIGLLAETQLAGQPSLVRLLVGAAAASLPWVVPLAVVGLRLRREQRAEIA
ncbi:MAG: oligosaccharide flippase family protein [Planctomycetota bacterium]